MASGKAYTFTIESDHTAFTYLYDGFGSFGETRIAATRLVVFGSGERINVQAEEKGARFLLVSGKPLGEPIARYGPFVMNTQEEIQKALQDLRDGTFVMKP